MPATAKRTPPASAAGKPTVGVVNLRIRGEERSMIDQGRGLGRALLRDAVLRSLAAAESVAARGLLVQALDEAARAFHPANGFTPSPAEPMPLMATLAAAG